MSGFIVTVLWEDQAGKELSRFGPHGLLVRCLADELGIGHPALATHLSPRVVPKPMKGRDKLREELRTGGKRLSNSGSVFAVVDRDRIRDLWKKDPPNNCKSAIRERFLLETPGTYELVFLEQNTETLLRHCCEVLTRPVPEQKPRPEERDDIFASAVRASADLRRAIRDRCPSFDRLVNKVTAELRPLFFASP